MVNFYNDWSTFIKIIFRWKINSFLFKISYLQFDHKLRGKKLAAKMRWKNNCEMWIATAL